MPLYNPSSGSSTTPRTYIPPNVQQFLSGSGTYTKAYAFVISSGSATTAATYTNNGNTYTVLNTVSSSTLIYLSGSADPTASGTLTKASGTGDATLTFSEFAKPVYLRATLVGGGGGGGGSSATSNNNGKSNKSIYAISRNIMDKSSQASYLPAIENTRAYTETRDENADDDNSRLNNNLNFFTRFFF